MAQGILTKFPKTIKPNIAFPNLTFTLIEMLDYVERRLFPNGIPTESTMSLTRKDYKLAGEIMAMSVMQGGQAPNLMSSKIFDYLRGKLSVSQIESSTTRELCEKVRLQIDKQCNYMLQIKFALINISNCMPPNFV